MSDRSASPAPYHIQFYLACRKSRHYQDHILAKIFFSVKFLPQQFMVNLIIFLLKHIEDHLLDPAILIQELPHGLNGNLSRTLLWKAEYTGGQTAERNGLHAMFCRKLQALPVTACQQFLILFGHIAADDGAYGVENVGCWKIVAGSDLRLTRRLQMALLFHDLVHLKAQLDSGVSVDKIVNAGVKWGKTA